MKDRLAALAAKGVYIGTSSWKYEGWLGQLYTAARYQKSGKPPRESSTQGLFPGLTAETVSTSPVKIDKKRFEQECLSEYAEVFKTVCVDSAFYTFPTESSLHKLADAVPDGFRFGFKVTDDITIRKFPHLDRFGSRAGKSNPNFLDAELFQGAFLRRCEAIRPKVGILMFEFSRFWPGDYKNERDFVKDLDGFLGRLPGDWPYAVEIRNRDWLVPEYFDCLSRHDVTHVYNSWEAMPSMAEQMAMPGSRTNPKRIAARFLLKPGRRYEAAVKQFQPYDKVKEPNPEARRAGWSLVSVGRDASGCELYIYVNNRLEGNALETIDGMLDATSEKLVP
jgi:uncharacterized protein YecE (DUF72 family)